ncbi:MAG: YdcF family protein [Candidatus Paceibacterota bacterium]|jgi:uncharacterized SAM-binding protein YcdF (DUF218 family)
MNRIIIVHGEKSKPSGEIHPAFIERLNKAIEISKQVSPDFIVIASGQTRKISPPEAQTGYDYLKDKIKTPILIEKESRTTIENIKFTKKLLTDGKIEINKLYVVTSRKRIFRIKFLYRRLWPEIYEEIEFIPTKDFYPILFYPYKALYLLLNLLDIKERFLLPLGKKFFRNG